MKVDIPNDLIPKLLRQLEVLGDQGGDGWDKTALGIFHGLLAQTKTRSQGTSVSKAAKKTRRSFKDAFRRG